MTAAVLILVPFAVMAGVLIYLGSQLNQVGSQLHQAQAELQRFTLIRDPEHHLSQVQGSTAMAERLLADLNAELAEKRAQLIELGERLDLQDFGFYEAKYQDLSLDSIGNRLARNKEDQKIAIRRGYAATCDVDWTVDGNRTKGRKMVSEHLKLMLRAFNGECDAAIARVKYDNANNMIRKIEAAFAAINKMGATKKCEISHEYFELKIEELRLNHEQAEKKHAEREEQRYIREQLREELKAEKEFEREISRAAKEERQWQQALERVRGELQGAAAAEKQKLLDKVARLEEKLRAAGEKRRLAVSRAEMTRTGHIYVISNIGSFGDEVFKIGLTRRMEPLERIRELGSASVPFEFDVHAIIFSDDAPALEQKIHAALKEKRINRVNMRKEFFRTSISEIESLIKEFHRDVEVRWTRLAEARQYRESLAIEKSLTRTPSTAPAISTVPLPLELGPTNLEAGAVAAGG